MNSTALRSCKDCSVELTPGINWSPGMVKNRSYLCMGCNSARGKRHYQENAAKALEVRRQRLRTPSGFAKDAEAKSSYYRANKEKWLVYHATAKQKHRTDPWARAARLLTWVRARAAKTGREFNLDLEWVGERLERGVCEVTGIALELQVSKIGQIHPWGPSVDRRDSVLGYTKENCQIVCWAYNIAKSDWDHAVVQRLAESLAIRP